MLFPNLALWLRFALTIAAALLISFVLTPPVKRLAEKVGAIDVPRDARRVHKHPIPRMGGLAIFAGFLVSVLLFADLTAQVRGILAGALVIVITGAIDDVVQLRYYIKLIGQIIAAAIAVASGVSISVLMNPNIFSSDPSLFLGALEIPITIIWIVGITNSVNLIDGLDGLACGVSSISSITMLIVALMVSESNVALILAALVGACLGFIPYNFNPAKLFMGDTGALLLGYILATVSVMGMFKFYAIVTFVVPILALALPLFDTLFAIVRRLLKGQNPMTPDRGHLHHRLIDMGLSQKQAVAVLYALSAVLGLTAVVISTRGELRILLLAGELVIVAAAGIFVLRTLEHPANHPAPDHTNPFEENYIAHHAAQHTADGQEKPHE